MAAAERRLRSSVRNCTDAAPSSNAADAINCFVRRLTPLPHSRGDRYVDPISTPASSSGSRRKDLVPTTSPATSMTHVERRPSARRLANRVASVAAESGAPPGMCSQTIGSSSTRNRFGKSRSALYGRNTTSPSTIGVRTLKGHSTQALCPPEPVDLLKHTRKPEPSSDAVDAAARSVHSHAAVRARQSAWSHHTQWRAAPRAGNTRNCRVEDVLSAGPESGSGGRLPAGPVPSADIGPSGGKGGGQQPTERYGSFM